MTNPKALAVTERAALSTTVFENPELTAMAAICEILQELPDEASRMRVMHWAFGRFAVEFKRPAAVPRSTVELTVVERTTPEPAGADVSVDASDMRRQITELEDLFAPSRPEPVDMLYADIFTARARA
jgi:hypothetical protein